MKERPILFSGEMVRAILDGRKTQTRRVITQVFELQKPDFQTQSDWMYRRKDALWEDVSTARLIEKFCPYGQPGDRLWVRETFGSFSQRHLVDHDKTYPVHKHMPNYPDVIAIYRASGADYPPHFYEDKMARWKPSIYMPRWASRIDLEVTGVRVERLQEIGEEDARAEGIGEANHFSWTVREMFRELWDTLNARRGSGWDTNPWVWVIEFRRIKP